VIHHLLNHIDLIIPDQPVHLVPLDLHDVHTKIDGLIDIHKVVFLFHIRMDLGDHFNLTARCLLIFGDQGIGWKADIDGVDTRLLGQHQGLVYFTFRIIGFKQGRCIDQITCMGPSTHQVASGHQPAYLVGSDLTFG